MITCSRRPFTEREAQELKKHLPPRLSWNQRRLAMDELRAGQAEVLEAELAAIHDANGCQPGCCPNAYLLRITGGAFIYAESWTHLSLKQGELTGRRLTLVRSPVTKRLLGATFAGEPIPISEPCLHDIVWDPGGAECEVLQADELPDELRRLIAP